ncbi:Halomucin, partial [Bienertia sinuspersici]
QLLVEFEFIFLHFHVTLAQQLLVEFEFIFVHFHVTLAQFEMVRTRGGATKKADDDTNDKVGKEDARKELSEDERGCVQNDEEDDDLNEEDGGDDDGEDGEEGGEINEEESEQEEEEEEQFGEEESGEDSDGQEKSSEGDVEDFDEEKESGEGDVEDSDEEKESSEGDVKDANEEPSDDSPIYKRGRKNARTEKVKKSNAPAKKMKVNKKDAPLEKKKNNEKCQRIENAPVEKVKKIRRSIEKVKKIRRPIEKVKKRGRPIEKVKKTGRPIGKVKKTGRPVEKMKNTGKPVEKVKQARRLVEKVKKKAEPNLKLGKQLKAKSDAMIAIGKSKAAETNVTVDSDSDCVEIRACNLLKIMENFTDDQKKSVREIGFGGMLNVCLQRTEQHMFPWFVENFDYSSWMFDIGGGKQFVITPYDVYDVFCLPLNPSKDVVETLRMGDNVLKSEWRDHFGVSGNIPLRLVEDKIKDLKRGGDEFKRLFVVLVFSTFLAPIANRTADLRFIKSLVNVNEIRSFNWCKYVLERLCEAVKNYKKGEQQSVSGCVLLLEILYFHRLKFRDIAESSTLPLIQHWTTLKVRDRIKMEREAKCFGSGILDEETYPVSKKLQFRDGAAVFPDSAPSHEVKGGNDAIIAADETLDCSQASIHNALMEMKQDIECRVEAVKDLAVSKNTSNPSSCPSSSTQTQQYFSDPLLHQIVDEIVGIVLAVKEIPGGLGNSSSDFVSPVVDPPNPNAIVSGIVNEINSLYGDSSGYESMFQSTLVNGQARCSISIGQPCDDVVYVSAFMRSNRAIMKSLPRLHQEIADFCLVDDDESPLLGVDLVWYDLNHSIPGDELLSLQGGEHIYQSVLEHWAILLNLNQAATSVKPQKFYFGVEQSVFIPMLISKHYFLFVCNFEKKTIQFLDNRVYEEKDIDQFARFLMFCTFLDIRCHPNASNILEFQMEVVNFDWKSSTETNDCGVYAMIHMLLFEGSSFTCEDLKRVFFSLNTKVKKRALLRAQICATLVLMDANSARSDVLTRLQEFNPQRGAIQKEVARRKKIKDQERKKQEEEENADKRKKVKEDKVEKSKQQQNKENVEKKREKLKECEAKKTSKQEKENADAKKRKKSSKDQADKQEKNSRKMAKKN